MSRKTTYEPSATQQKTYTTRDVALAVGITPQRAMAAMLRLKQEPAFVVEMGPKRGKQLLLWSEEALSALQADRQGQKRNARKLAESRGEGSRG
jgi:hypothetical protein